MRAYRRPRYIKMPVYQFAVKWDDDQSSDVRYTHLADEEAAASTPNSSYMSSHRAVSIFHVFAFRGERRERTAVFNAIPRNCPLTYRAWPLAANIQVEYRVVFLR